MFLGRTECLDILIKANSSINCADKKVSQHDIQCQTQGAAYLRVWLIRQWIRYSLESFSYEWETYGMELRSRYGIELIVFNQSQRAKSFLNQSECLETARWWRGMVTAWPKPYRNHFPLIRKWLYFNHLCTNSQLHLRLVNNTSQYREGSTCTCTFEISQSTESWLNLLKQ